jgi:hypothetical protein
MHWSRRRELLRLQREEILLARLQVTMQVLVRQQLWEMALPLAEALRRLDQRTLVSQMQQVDLHQQQQELLLDLLQATVPPVSQQLGLSNPPR